MTERRFPYQPVLHGGGAPAAPVAPANITVQRVHFPPLAPPPDAQDPSVDLNLLRDVPVTIMVQLDTVKVPLETVLSYKEGMLIELNKLAGENVDVFLNGRRIAIGEIIVINDKFGVRITEVITPLEALVTDLEG